MHVEIAVNARKKAIFPISVSNYLIFSVKRKLMIGILSSLHL